MSIPKGATHIRQINGDDVYLKVYEQTVWLWEDEDPEAKPHWDKLHSIVGDDIRADTDIYTRIQ
jgi:hypothetical protein